MSFPKYSAYKDSGVEWLGEIPTHWEALRLRFLCWITTGDKDTQDAQPDGEYPFFVRSETIERSNNYSFDGEGVFTSGDGAGVGKIFHHFTGKCAIHQRVYLFHNFTGVTGKFFYHYLRSQLEPVVLAQSAKSTVDSLRLPMLQNFWMTCPSLYEQTQIVRFVEHETAKIDSLIEEQQRLIELLKEKRQAMISQAVTKGLDPSAAMKDSGVEWLREVPSHWAVSSIKHLSDKITDGAHVSPETENGVFHFVSTKDVSDDFIDFDNALRTSAKSFEYLVKAGCQPKTGDVLFSKDGTIGRTVVVREAHDFVIASSLIIIRPMANVVDSDFLNFLCQSRSIASQVECFVKGAGLPRLSIQNLKKVIGCFPPLSEQKLISAFLNEELAKFNVLTTEAERVISVLQERRWALISAAVTGKIDVRGWHPPKSSGHETHSEDKSCLESI